jgi:hypothetical protein
MRAAAESGEPLGQLGLDTFYDEGVGVTRDVAQGTQWFTLAARAADSNIAAAAKEHLAALRAQSATTTAGSAGPPLGETLAAVLLGLLILSAMSPGSADDVTGSSDVADRINEPSRRNHEQFVQGIERQIEREREERERADEQRRNQEYNDWLRRSKTTRWLSRPRLTRSKSFAHAHSGSGSVRGRGSGNGSSHRTVAGKISRAQPYEGERPEE